MNLNTYEVVYILKPDIAELASLALVNNYKTLIKDNGGQNVVVQLRGRRHLTHNVSHYYDGIYVQVDYQGNGSVVKAVEKLMRFDKNVLRYLTVKK